MLAVTHDRKLIAEAATRTLRLTENGLEPFALSEQEIEQGH